MGDDGVVGAGFLVNDQNIVTCAHVIVKAWEPLPKDMKKDLSPQVYLDFPLVEPGKNLTAHVIKCNFKQDIAILKLDAPPPKGAKSVRLVISEDMWAHKFRTFGFPLEKDDGVYASGLLRDTVGSGAVQIEDFKVPGYRVQPGFSGAPVWDEELNGIVGMVNAADTKETDKVAFIVPCALLADVCCEAGITLSVMDAARPQDFEVIIQEESFRFNKYPFLVRAHGKSQIMANMSYAEITIQNCRNTEIKKCSLEIILRKEGKDIYCEKVLSADSTNQPNPMTVSIDGTRKVGFHPACLHLASFQAFLPDHSLKVAGKISGKLIKYDEYEIFGKVICDGKLGKSTYLGKINIPADFLTKAKIPNDIQVIIDQGGFAVYAELVQGKVRAKFYGHFTDGDVKRALKALNKEYVNVDMIVEENGKERSIDKDVRPQGVLGS